MESNGNLVPTTQENVRMAGFLEKKGKMKLMSAWKKYWFVLEERLLLYYRSEVEYTNLSPCRGSLNMGLVSTVRPGPSTGPCIIHIITRTQVVQLRAKDRVTQEEWLQALLHSMSLPLVTKTLNSPTLKNGLLGFGTSLDNITLYSRLRHTNLDNEWTLPRKLGYRKRQISGTVYGGSLDTAIWSKKLKPVRTSSPNIPKGKMLEKIVGFAKESDLCLVAVPQRGSRLSLNNESEMKYLGKNSDLEELCEEEEKDVKCKVHDENQNHGLYSVVDKKKKKVNKTLSDTELSKTESFSNLDKKDKSSFERIKNALSKIPTEKILRSKPKTEKRTRPSKQRRQSFLQKVFKKKETESHECESDISDPLYDTIDNVQEQNRSLTPEVFTQKRKNSKRDLCEEKEEEREEKDCDSSSSEFVEDSLYSEVHKTVAGSKTILPAQTMSELKTKLKSRENVHKHELTFLDEDDAENCQKSSSENKKDEAQAPSLPPRRVSRPISPWHDVPTNNAPIDNNKTSFFVHQAVVKFNNPMRLSRSVTSKTENKFVDDDDTRLDWMEQEKRESSGGSTEFQSLDKNKSDDLSILLEQLTKITVAPLAEPEFLDDNYNYSSGSESLWNKSQSSDPDYAIPRPHKPLILTSPGNEIISSTEFMGRSDDYSDSSSSFRSMEPDSLEMTEKKIAVQS